MRLVRSRETVAGSGLPAMVVTDPPLISSPRPPKERIGVPSVVMRWARRSAVRAGDDLSALAAD
ncbi:hypothetical protein ACFYZ3_15395 [Streptomyces sp. NPDC001599]|uniref:hypothetical protein n=1 Tax=Streptomyces sp. NPDC001599 TaxID=3364591 RepID=UPI0036804D5F